ncbi:DUF4037 domain-containing protein [Metabacillus sp. KIGAM252]|uniref:DUF4037 domain-containing protein n=1 Tax=Metabacillus flavus TaxID=2823519 RepID=A0ABS5LBC9_9BACI|nr:DUF4037 domain-containing protein [Metabacillus flavus]MBS2967941.1 DUF4037 domain-containing protein [Metabacillus flavus]
MELKDLAVKMAEIYKCNPKVDTIWLGGSVSRGWEDRYSDIELFLCWSEEPSDEDRLLPIQEVKGEIIDFHDYEDEEWSETYHAHGVKMELSHFLTRTVDSVIGDVIYRLSTDLEKQCLAAAVFNGKCLAGEDTFQRLIEKTAVYPESLKLAMITENLKLGSRWRNRDALVERQDWLLLHQIFVTVQRNVMSVLFALNETYVHHPGFKWQRQSLGEMNRKPALAAERMENVFLKDPKQGLVILEELLKDVYQLVKDECPALSIDPLIQANQSFTAKKTGKS